MNKLILFSFALLSLNLMADEEIAAEDPYYSTDECQPSCRVRPPVCPKPCPPKPVCTPAVNLCTAAPLSSNGWYVFGDLLYWHADVDGADYAFKNSDTTAAVIGGPNHALNFKWSYGFRAGIGANIDYDQWDTNFYYTWFHTQNSNSTGTRGAQVAVDNIGSVGLFTQGTIDWRIHYSMLDWELGRWFYVSKQLSLRPHVGVKGGWINQKVNKKITTTVTNFKVNQRNHFWGVGVSGGLNTNWAFVYVHSNRFSLFGDLAGAILYGHFDIDNSELTSAGGGFKPSDLNRNLAVPMVQAMLGLGWDTGFNCDRCHIGIKLGYEFQFWFRQNQMLTNETTVGGTVRYQRENGNLAFQGLTLDIKFDF